MYFRVLINVDLQMDDRVGCAIIIFTTCVYIEIDNMCVCVRLVAQNTNKHALLRRAAPLIYLNIKQDA